MKGIQEALWPPVHFVDLVLVKVKRRGLFGIEVLGGNHFNKSVPLEGKSLYTDFLKQSVSVYPFDSLPTPCLDTAGPGKSAVASHSTGSSLVSPPIIYSLCGSWNDLFCSKLFIGFICLSGLNLPCSLWPGTCLSWSD